MVHIAFSMQSIAPRHKSGIKIALKRGLTTPELGVLFLEHLFDVSAPMAGDQRAHSDWLACPLECFFGSPFAFANRLLSSCKGLFAELLLADPVCSALEHGSHMHHEETKHRMQESSMRHTVPVPTCPGRLYSIGASVRAQRVSM